MKRCCLSGGDSTSRASPSSERVAEPLLIRHPIHAGRIDLAKVRTVLGAAACLAILLAACQQAREEAAPIAATPEAQATIDEYLRKVVGRFGALALSEDGTRAAYYICQSRLWKNCDNYELNDRFVSVPSGQLASREALSRCGGGCNILYLNEQRQR
jgi:hypothetical protein